jgi:WD40 repeat protein
LSGKKLHEYDTWTASFAFTKDGKYLATTNNSNKVQIRQISNDQVLHEWSIVSGEGDIAVYSIDSSPDSQYLLLAGTLQVNRYSIVDSPVQLRSLSGDLVAELKGHRGGVLSAKFSSDGKLILTGGMDGTVKVWDFSGKQKSQWKAHSGWVRSAIFLDNQRVASVGDDGLVKVWTLTGQQLAEFKGHQGKITSLAYDRLFWSYGYKQT